jgi:hypothetical protein
MSDETKEHGELGIPWIAPEEGICEIYSNITHINWAAYDIRIRFGHLITDGATWSVSEEAAVTMPYGQAKYLRNLLHGIIQDYEAKNGTINISPVWPTPTAPLEPSSE